MDSEHGNFVLWTARCSCEHWASKLVGPRSVADKSARICSVLISRGRDRNRGHHGRSSAQARRGGATVLSRGTEQHRGRAGAAWRHIGQQRRLLPRLRFPEARAFPRAAAPPYLRGGGRAHPHGQDRDADHAEDLPAGGRKGRRPDGGAICRAAGRRGRHRRQRYRLRTRYLRSRHAPRADHRRRGHGQHRL